jgi:prepilin peptidase CpaA
MPDIVLTPLCFMLPILVVVGYSDLRHMRIPNMLSYLALAVFVVTAPMVGWSELALRAVVATAIFVLGFAAFALRLFGGGDIKIMAALMLFIPSQTLTVFALCFSASMIIGILFVLIVRKFPQRFSVGWTGLTETGKFPMGISIALSGPIYLIAVTVLYAIIAQGTT